MPPLREEELFSISLARECARVHVYTRDDIDQVGETLISDPLILRISMKRDSIENSRLRRLKHCLKLAVNASEFERTLLLF